MGNIVSFVPLLPSILVSQLGTPYPRYAGFDTDNRDMRLVPLLTGWMMNGMAGLGVLSPSSQKIT